jgi:nucleoside-diphosphate-sugar epimerase
MAITSVKILVTGGLGLIGHNIVNKLESLGHEITIVDNKTNYGIIPADELNYLMNERIKKIKTKDIFNADITDYHALDEIITDDKPEIIIHLASFPRQKVVNINPRAGSRTMSEGLINLLELAKKYQVRRFVYISSSMVYGDFTDDVTEDAVCKPQGQYGIMKLAGEWLVKDYTRSCNLEHTIIRPSAVYGPLDVEDRVISKFILSALRGQTLKVNGVNETLDFTYVDDVANGIVSATLSENAINKTYNITKSHSRTLKYAAELAVKLAGKGSIEIKDKDADFPSRGSLNIAAARNDFNFDPKVDVEEGFKIYYDWIVNSFYWSTKL